MKARSKAGFTLVELMVVAIIVAILAAVAIPLMTAQKKRAMATEAEAGLGSMRTAFRAIYAEKGRYDINPNTGAAIPVGAAPTNLPGISASDLDGKYFVNTDYSVSAIGQNTYTLRVAGSTNDVSGIVITLDNTGTFNRQGL